MSMRRVANFDFLEHVFWFVHLAKHVDYRQKNRVKYIDRHNIQDQFFPFWSLANELFERVNRKVIAFTNALNHFNPSDTAFVQESFKPSVTALPVADSAASIQLVKNDNDVINYSFNSSTAQFAVFSEVYYPAGWKAYIDNKESPIVKTDYVLRGLAVPAGKHDIRFEFKPDGFYKGKKFTAIFEILLALLLVVALFMEWRSKKRK